MSAGVQHIQPNKADARPVKRLIAPVLVVVLGFCAVCAYVLVEARNATWQRAAEVAVSLAAAIEADVGRNIETLDLSLQSISNNLDLPEFAQFGPDIRRRILFDLSATAHHLGKIIVLDETGHIRYDSTSLTPLTTDLSDRDYFLAHKNSATTGLFISKPSISRLTGIGFVGLSRRLSHPDGSFSGIAVASLRLTYFEKMFKDVMPGPNGSITLLRTDGTVLMRWPRQAGTADRNLRHAKLFDYFAKARKGSFETYIPSQDVRRLVTYSQIGHFPLIVAVGQSTRDIYAQWRSYAFSVSLMIVLLCVITFILAMYFVRELGRRRNAEAKLAVLAATDSLTGLANRRHFKEAIGREWQRAMRDSAPLGLMMVDVDKFKAYNDVHGHQAGDNLLKTVGAAIVDSLKRGGDIGARYGGDEFAVLLAGTGAEGAERVAENIRAALSAHCERDGIISSGLSIGIACLTPVAGDIFAELIQLADVALYRAKNLGRGRTETAAKPEPAPALAVALALAKPDQHKAA